MHSIHPTDVISILVDMNNGDPSYIIYDIIMGMHCWSYWNY